MADAEVLGHAYRSSSTPATAGIWSHPAGGIAPGDALPTDTTSSPAWPAAWNDPHHPARRLPPRHPSGRRVWNVSSMESKRLSLEEDRLFLVAPGDHMHVHAAVGGVAQNALHHRTLSSPPSAAPARSEHDLGHLVSLAKSTSARAGSSRVTRATRPEVGASWRRRASDVSSPAGTSPPARRARRAGHLSSGP